MKELWMGREFGGNRGKGPAQGGGDILCGGTPVMKEGEIIQEKIIIPRPTGKRAGEERWLSQKEGDTRIISPGWEEVGGSRLLEGQDDWKTESRGEDGCKYSLLGG